MTESLEKENETTATATTAEPARKNRLEKVGKVVSNKMDKTIVVEVEYLKRHSLYKKSMRRTSRFKAHDEDNACQMGDLVRIEESRPYSKEKTWRLVEIIQKGVQL